MLFRTIINNFTKNTCKYIIYVLKCHSLLAVRCFPRQERQIRRYDMTVIDQIEKEQLRNDITPFNIGDTVRVMVKVVEGDKERIQAYEGVVIAKKGAGIKETFTVRRVSYGIGVERTFPMHSPRIDKVIVVRKGKVRRAKIYYIRNLSGKAAKVKEVK